MIGSGGMGAVYRAYDTKLKRSLAIKVLRESGGSDQLLREAQSASALSHSAICTVYEVGTEQDATFIAMEFVDGESLAVEDRARTARDVRRLAARHRGGRCARSRARARRHPSGLEGRECHRVDEWPRESRGLRPRAPPRSGNGRLANHGVALRPRHHGVGRRTRWRRSR